MSPLTLLDRLAEQGLLARPLVVRLREQLQKSSAGWTAESLAAWLVERKQLTEEQSRRVLQSMARDAAATSLSLPDLPPLSPPESSPPVPPPLPRNDDDLGLAPEADELVPVEEEDEAVELVAPVTAEGDEILSVDEAMRDSRTDARRSRPSKARDQVPDGMPVVDSSVVEPISDLIEEIPEAGRRLTSSRGWWSRLTSGGDERRAASNRWDSPLILFGSGGLALMLILGAGLYLYLTRGTGEEAYQAANEAYRQQAYGQAIAGFREFVDNYPGHPKESLARVRVVLAELRDHVEHRRWDDGLQVAQSGLPTVVGQAAFGEVRPELATLLPEMMEGFAEQAAKADQVADAERWLKQSEDSLQIIDNPAYLPTSVRRSAQARIERAIGKLDGVRRRINQDRRLRDAVAQIDEFVDAKNVAQAYTARADLLKAYPTLELDERLQSAIERVAQVERTLVQSYVPLPEIAATASTPPSDLQVTMAHREGDTIASLADQMITLPLAGSFWGLRADNGQLMWRHGLGGAAPIVWDGLGDAGRGDVIVYDPTSHDLLRLVARTGKMVWQLPCPGTVQAVRVVSGRCIVLGNHEAQGYLLAIDPETGKAIGGVRTSVPLRAPPAFDSERGTLVFPADHATLYEIQMSDWSCTKTQFLGHAAGTVTVAPVRIGDAWVIVENAGPELALLHVWGQHPEKSDQWQPLTEPVRLAGQVAAPLLVSGRRLLVVTDRGKVQVYEVDTSQTGKPIRLAAEAADAVSTGVASQASWDEGRLWVGDSQLSLYELQAARGQLVRKSLAFKGDTFLVPPRRLGNVLIHARQREGRSAATIAASRVGDGPNGGRDGDILWQTDVAAAPAGEPIVQRSPQEVHLVTQDGHLFALGKEEIRTGLAPVARLATLLFDGGRLQAPAELTTSTRAYIGERPGTQILWYDQATQPATLRTLRLQLGGARVVAPPALLDDHQLVIAADDGTIQVVDTQTGRSTATPFSPAQSAGTRVTWWPPLVTTNPLAVLALDRSGGLYRLEPNSQDEPHLQVARERRIDGVPATPPVILGDQLFVPTHDATAHEQLRRYRVVDLEPLDVIDLPGRVTWGPVVASNHVWLQVDGTNCWSIDAAGTARSVEWNAGAIVGRPGALGDGLLFSTLAGQIVHVDIASGKIVGQQAINSPCGSGPLVFAGQRVLVAGHDGTLHVITWGSK